MKIGLLADIHANAHALEAVLESAKKNRVEKLLCCGDYVGYYYEPDKVMALLNEWDWIGVSGNHEAMLMNWLNEERRSENLKTYGSGISVAADVLTPDTSEKLCNMPIVTKLSIDKHRVMLCHGSPWDRDSYIYPDADQDTIDRMFTHDPDFDLLVYGHTHYQATFNQSAKKIINPGSVGQPRDRIGGAAWALWDTTTNDVELHREEYDVHPVIEMCEAYNPDIGYLVKVLVRR
jgi:putative phosphoesterase